MVRTRIVPSLLALLLAGGVASARSTAPGEPPPSPGSPGASGLSSSERAQRDPRREAEETYARAYEEVAKAQEDLEAGKSKNAEKRFRRAFERCERAVALDERYHEAWNLLGFTARKLGDYDKAFRAYDRCLTIKPDYAPAREYLGEAWLEKGDAKKARDQLVWLERLGATEEFKMLKARYDAWASEHPEASPAEPAPAKSDTASSGRGASGS